MGEVSVTLVCLDRSTLRSSASGRTIRRLITTDMVAELYSGKNHFNIVLLHNAKQENMLVDRLASVVGDKLTDIRSSARYCSNCF